MSSFAPANDDCGWIWRRAVAASQVRRWLAAGNFPRSPTSIHLSAERKATMGDLIRVPLSRSRQWRQRGDRPFRSTRKPRSGRRGRGRSSQPAAQARVAVGGASPAVRRVPRGATVRPNTGDSPRGGRPSLARRAGDGFAGSLLCHGEQRRILTRGPAFITRSVMATVGGTGVSPVRAARGPAILARRASRVVAGGGAGPTDEIPLGDVHKAATALSRKMRHQRWRLYGENSLAARPLTRLVPRHPLPAAGRG
jgi:hypothetical protein